MLKQRVLTAVVLASLVTCVVLFASSFWFAVFVGAVVLLGAWEWSNLSGLTSALHRGLYVVGVFAILSLSGALQSVFGKDFLLILLIATCAWWALALQWVQSYPAGEHRWCSQGIRILIGLLVLIPAWQALTYLRSLEQGPWVVLTFLGVVAAADTGAYFTGKAFGKRKLAPKVSPGKTWEGVVGGVAVAAIFLATILYFTVAHSIYWALALAIPTALVSVLGDLFESMLKRYRGIKDSGNLLPGHGGILDRVDGLVAASPVFALVLLLAGWPAQ